MFGKKETKEPIQTLGIRIAAARTAKNMKQSDLAERLGVSAQAVSKWENDVSAPDISILPALARELDMSVDELLTGEKKEPEVQLLPAEKRNIDKLVLRVYVDSAEGDRVRVNLPMALVKVAIETGIAMPQINGSEALKNIDFAQIFTLVENGAIGNLVDIESANGDIVKVFVE